MATFREIDERLLQLVDEDGEILDVAEFEALQMERAEKAQNMALWALDLKDEQEDIKREIQRLQARLRAAERREKNLRDYLGQILRGEKLKTPRVSVSYRQTEAVEIPDENALREWAMRDPKGEDVLRYKEPEISRTEVKRLIGEGVAVPGAEIATRISTIIK